MIIKEACIKSLFLSGDLNMQSAVQQQNWGNTCLFLLKLHITLLFLQQYNTALYISPLMDVITVWKEKICLVLHLFCEPSAFYFALWCFISAFSCLLHVIIISLSFFWTPGTIWWFWPPGRQSWFYLNWMRDKLFLNHLLMRWEHTHHMPFSGI